METESKPAPLVEVEYLADVTAPDFKVGKKGEKKQIERHWAQQLVAEGYARFTAESEVKHGSSDSGADSEGPGSQA